MPSTVCRTVVNPSACTSIVTGSVTSASVNAPVVVRGRGERAAVLLNADDGGRNRLVVGGLNGAR